MSETASNGRHAAPRTTRDTSALVSNDIGHVTGNAVQIGELHVHDGAVLGALADRACSAEEPVRIRVLARTELRPLRARQAGRRSQLADLHKRLAAGHRVLICGPAGIGKTSFLDHATNEGVLSADSVPKCEGLLRPAVHSANPKDVLRALAFRCTGTSNAAALHLLSTLRALVVLDGVDWLPAQIDVLLTAMPNSVFVVTSRNTALSPLFRPLPLSGLSTAETEELMEIELDEPLSAAEAQHLERIRADCDGNPSVLVQIGATSRLARTSVLSGEFDADAACFIVPRLLDIAGMPASTALRTLLVLPDTSWGAELLRGTLDEELEGVAALVHCGLVTHESGRYRVAHNVVDVVSPLRDAGVEDLFDRITTWIAAATPEQVFTELSVVEPVLHRMLEGLEHRAAVALAHVVSTKLLPSLWWDRGDRVLKLGLLAAVKGGFRADEVYFRKALAIRRAADRQLDEAFTLTAAVATSLDADTQPLTDLGTIDMAGSGSGGTGGHLRQAMANAAARVMGTPAMVNITSVVHGAPALVRAAAFGTAALAICGVAVLGSRSDAHQADAAPTTVVTGTRDASLPLLPGPTGTSASQGPATTTASSGAPAPSTSDVPSEVGVPAPDTIGAITDAPTGPASANGGTSMVRNAGFDQPSGTGPTSVTGGAPGKPAGGKSAAADWPVYNNSNGGTTTTELVPSTGPNGGQMLHVCTSQPYNEIFQYFATTVGVGPVDAVAEVWINVERGRVGVGIGNGGSTSLRASNSGEGRWELLRASSGTDPATEVVIAAIAADTCFSVDSVSTRP